MSIRSFLSSWRIALLCSLINTQHLGQKKIMGLQFVAMLERYNASREQASFALSLGSVVFFLCGPIVGYLSSKFEMKTITICGCFIASISIAGCFFAEDVLFLTLWWGLPSAISTCMAINLLPSFLHFHNKTKQTMANGIALVGPCLGGFLFTPFYKLLLDIYGMSGAFLILGAIALHSVPAAMLLENPKPKHKTKSDLNLIKKLNSASTENLEENKHSTWKDATEHTTKFCAFNESTTTIKIPIIDSKFSPDYAIGKNSSEIITAEISSSKTEKENAFNDAKMDYVEDEQDTKNCENIFIPINIAVSDLPCTESCVISNGSIIKNEQTCHPRADSEPFIDVNMKCKTSHMRFDSDFSITNDSRNSAEIDNTRLDPSKTIRSYSVGSNTHGDIVDTLPHSSLASENQKTETYKEVANIAEITDNRRSNKPYSVLYDPIFLLVSFTTSSHMFVNVVMLTVVVDFSIDKGLSIDQGVYVLMCLTITDMVGRFSFSWVTDKGHMSSTKFIATCYLTLALCLAIFTETTNFFSVVISLAVAGVIMGALIPVFPVLMSEYFPGKMNAMALASMNILMVPACLVVSPMIGYFREYLGSYVLMFYCVNSVCLLCCVTTFFVPTIARLRKKKILK